jgi:hypothetical protein
MIKKVSETVIFEQIPVGSKGDRSVVISAENTPGRREIQ